MKASVSATAVQEVSSSLLEKNSKRTVGELKRAGEGEGGEIASERERKRGPKGEPKHRETTIRTAKGLPKHRETSTRTAKAEERRGGGGEGANR